MSNPCIRCGEERVVSKSWKEVVEVYGRQTTITNTDFVCADKVCQKLVEKELIEGKAKRILLEKQKEKEKQTRLKNSLMAKAHRLKTASLRVARSGP